ncbi:hypothetical protein WN51_08679 [Melipona quadrifasciata]|uniref:Uncharacterized protein n=1 Tax=Melipona quadrifasciata TaxID=166423 RepID=A0A0M9A7N8_9HYME|nr:hypothetical protein WN51_08679 [Melipona quadrifasciata]
MQTKKSLIAKDYKTARLVPQKAMCLHEFVFHVSHEIVMFVIKRQTIIFYCSVQVVLQDCSVAKSFNGNKWIKFLPVIQ